MRKSTALLAMLLLNALPVAAQEEASSNLLQPEPGLIIWTWVIFLLVFGLLAWKAYPAILGAVEAREKALADALESAKKDREAAAAALAEQQKKLEQTREEAQKLIAEGRAAGDKVRVDVIAQAKAEHDAMLERARAQRLIGGARVGDLTHVHAPAIEVLRLVRERREHLRVIAGDGGVLHQLLFAAGIDAR